MRSRWKRTGSRSIGATCSLTSAPDFTCTPRALATRPSHSLPSKECRSARFRWVDSAGSIPLGRSTWFALRWVRFRSGRFRWVDSARCDPVGFDRLSRTPLGSIPLGSHSVGCDRPGRHAVGCRFRWVRFRWVDSARFDSARVDSAGVDSARVDSARVDSARVDSVGVVPLGSLSTWKVRRWDRFRWIDSARLDRRRGSPFGSIPLGSIPLGSINIDCAAIDCDTATLGEAVAAGAVQRRPRTRRSRWGTRSGIRLGRPRRVHRRRQRGRACAPPSTLDERLDCRPADARGSDPGRPADWLQPSRRPARALGDGLNLVTFADVVDAIIDPITGAPIPKASSRARRRDHRAGSDRCRPRHLRRRALSDLFAVGRIAIPPSPPGGDRTDSRIHLRGVVRGRLRTSRGPIPDLTMADLATQASSEI